jgi:tetratricopeptide (TPR) repeat protein
MARSRFPVWLLAAVLALVTIALYWPATGYDFVSYDDPDFITTNPHVQAGLTWEGVKWAFLNTQQATYWAPLMWLSHMLACQFFGLNPWGQNLVNVLLHAANTALVFLVFWKLTGATWRSAILAALFALHPLRVESVAWVTERKDVLSAFFFMLTVWAYARYAEVPSPKSNVQSPETGKQGSDSRFTQRATRNTQHALLFYLLSLFFFALGLMSKPMLVTLPCVLLLLDYWPLERFKAISAWRLVREKIPFFALSAATSVLTFVVQKRGGVLEASEYLPLGARAGNALISYWRYLEKLFWPANLAVFYPHPERWPAEQVLLAGLSIVGISVLLFVKRRRYPSLLMGWLWFGGTLVPAIGLIQSGSQAMADRFTYVPSLGVLILAIWGAYELTRGRHYPMLALAVVDSVAIILCMALTRQQLEHWQDSEHLFRHALEVTENNYIARSGLGTALVEKGQFDEAISQFQESLRLKPDSTDAHYNLGNALYRKGQFDEAISEYQESLRLKPDSMDAHCGLGNALDSKGQLGQAISQFQEVIRLHPDYALAHNNLGFALLRQGQIEEAIGQYQEAIRLKPNYALARNNLGNALYRKGRDDEAISQYQEVLRLEPGYAETHNDLGLALYRKGRAGQAISQFQEALRLKPDLAAARKNLDYALAAKAGSSTQPGASTNR